MGQYTSYYLYQKYEQREGQDPIPCIPSIYSIDADGTMEKVIKIGDDPECGYVPPTPTEAIYRWYQMPITEDYICANCGDEPTGSSTNKIVLHFPSGYGTCEEPCDGNTTLYAVYCCDGVARYDAVSAEIGDCISAIGESAFRSQSGLTSVTIPDSVTSIGGGAFNRCVSLTSITIPDSVTSIDYGAFAYCTRLLHIEIPPRVTYIGNCPFSHCSSLMDITFTSTTPPRFYNDGINILADVNASIFVPCESLESYKAALPDYYSDRIFCATPPPPAFGKFSATYLDSSMHVINCDSSTVLTSAETRDFSASTTAMTNCIIGSCVTEIGYQAIGVGNYNKSSLTSVTIQEGVEIIGERAFVGSSGLTTLEIPNSVTTIKRNAFMGCNSLQTLTIGSGITSFSGGTVISGLGKLTSLTVMASTPPTVWQSEFYSVNTGLTVYVPCESVTAYYKDPRWGTLNIQGISTCDTVYRLKATKVGYNGIFYKECKSPTNYENTLTSGDTDICASGVCVDHNDMETVEIGCTTIIGEKAFSGYTNLVSVTFHEGLKKIRSEAFRHCDSLSSITIPSTVTEIGSEAFLYCDNVQSLTLLCTTVPEVNYGSFPDGNIYPIYVPAESVDLYKSRWSGWADRIYPIS